MPEILLHPKKVLTYRPNPDGPLKIFLRAPSLDDETVFKTEVLAAGGNFWTYTDLVEAAVEAIEERLLPGEENAELRQRYIVPLREYAKNLQAVFKSHDSNTPEGREAILAAMKPPEDVDEIFREVQELDEKLRRMQANNAVFHEIQGNVATRMFVVGWEGLEDEEGKPLTFRRGLRGPSEETLKSVPRGVRAAIGGFVSDLMNPNRRTVGNSASESSGSTTPTPGTNGTDTVPVTPSSESTAAPTVTH